MDRDKTGKELRKEEAKDDLDILEVVAERLLLHSNELQEKSGSIGASAKYIGSRQEDANQDDTANEEAASEFDTVLSKIKEGTDTNGLIAHLNGNKADCAVAPCKNEARLIGQEVIERQDASRGEEAANRVMGSMPIDATSTKELRTQQATASAVPTGTSGQEHNVSLPGAYACAGLSETSNVENTTAVGGDSDSASAISTRSTGDDDSTIAASIEEGLAQAMPIEDTNPQDLPHAAAVDMEEKDARHPEMTHKPRRSELLLLAFLVLMIVIVGVGVTLAIRTEKQGSRNSTPSTISTNLPGSIPLDMSRREHILSLLPLETLQAIEEDPFSPQSLALDFCRNDPNLDSYPDWRILQRFALVTLFYATSGEQWKDNSGYLSHKIHECQWYACPFPPQNVNAKKEGLTKFHGAEYNNPCDNVDPAVVEKEVYVKLWIWSHKLDGTIPVEVGIFLTSLMSVSLGHNPNIQGTIPSQLGLLTNMELLDLAGTSVTGTIPVELGNVSSSLKSLHLTDTHVSGVLPELLANVTTLRIDGTGVVVP